MPQSINVGVLGATGTVGQRFLVLLDNHPFFKVSALGASARSANQAYKKAVNWKQSVPIPEYVQDLTVHECDPAQFAGCEIVFSGLDSSVATEVESAFRAAEFRVFSNASNYRRDPLCPLIVPLVNEAHMGLVPFQKKTLGLATGCIVTNANCSTTGIAIPFKALEDEFGPLETVMVTTMQAISGAGYPGVSSLDILDNVVPYIGGEEEKIEWELNKILGGLNSDKSAFVHRSLNVSAQCNRVPVLDGHMECCSVRFAQRPPPSPQQVIAALRAYQSASQKLACPSAPAQAIIVHDEPDRPQPRLDRYFQSGASVSVGRVRECPVLDIKFVVLSNNVSIGAATSSLINAEYAVLSKLV